MSWFVFVRALPMGITMKHDYGYIVVRRFEDGDHIDVYLMNKSTAGNVYIAISRSNGQVISTNAKVMYGFNSMEEAVQAYRDQ